MMSKIATSSSSLLQHLFVILRWDYLTSTATALPPFEVQKMKTLVTQPLEPLIHVVRDTRVMLDSDLARLYGVTTSGFNQAFKRNRFPEDFAFKLTAEEWETLTSVPKTGNLSQFVTGSRNPTTPDFRAYGK